MKLLAMALCLSFVPVFGQDPAPSVDRLQRPFEQWRNQAQDELIQKAITLQQTFWLSDKFRCGAMGDNRCRDER